MTWMLWFVIIWLALEPIAAVALIGRPREPVTRTTAVATLFVMTVLISFVVLGGIIR